MLLLQLVEAQPDRWNLSMEMWSAAPSVELTVVHFLEKPSKKERFHGEDKNGKRLLLAFWVVLALNHITVHGRACMDKK